MVRGAWRAPTSTLWPGSSGCVQARGAHGHEVTVVTVVRLVLLLLVLRISHSHSYMHCCKLFTVPQCLSYCIGVWRQVDRLLGRKVDARGGDQPRRLRAQYARSRVHSLVHHHTYTGPVLACCKQVLSLEYKNIILYFQIADTIPR